MSKITAFAEKVLSDKRIKYLFVGGSAFLLEYGLFLILNSTLNLLILANVLSFVVGLVYSFVLHQKWTFAGDHKHDPRKQAASYLLLALVNVVLTSFIITLLVDSLGVLPFVAKIICMLLVVAWNFLILNKIIFKVAQVN